jgi:hypothetical protein
LGLSQFLEASLNKWEYKICVAHVLRLMDVLEVHDSYFEFFQKQADSLLKGLERPDFNDDEINKGLHALSRRIGTDKKIGVMPVAAFLATEFFGYEHNSETRMIKAVIFITSYHLSNLEGEWGVVERALREVRLMITDMNADMMRQLPDFTQDINTVIEEIKASRIRIISAIS